MREALRTRFRDLLPDHVGLAYDVYAPVHAASGKIPDADRIPWLNRLAQSVPDGAYRAAYDRWVRALQSTGARARILETTSRMLVGHGNPSATEVGITLQHTWSVPTIPGSSLKGLLAHYLDATYGPDEAVGHPMDTTLAKETKEHAAFRGPTWLDGVVQHGPGAVYRTMFGAPEAATDDQYPGSGPARGGLVFHDAWLVPDTPRAERSPFAVDVLTVHQRRYYDGAGSVSPTDYDDPNPVTFLTVRPGTRFLVALGGPTEWTRFAMQQLGEAMGSWGVGGKSAAGYGRGQLGARDAVDPDARVLEASPVIRELTAWADQAGQQNLSQRQCLADLRAHWRERLRAIVGAERAEAQRIVLRRVRRTDLRPQVDVLFSPSDDPE